MQTSNEENQVIEKPNLICHEAIVGADYVSFIFHNDGNDLLDLRCHCDYPDNIRTVVEDDQSYVDVVGSCLLRLQFLGDYGEEIKFHIFCRDIANNEWQLDFIYNISEDYDHNNLAKLTKRIKIKSNFKQTSTTDNDTS